MRDLRTSDIFSACRLLSAIGIREEIKEVAKVGEYDAVVPMITGSCYLTGFGTYLIDQDDPLKSYLPDLVKE